MISILVQLLKEGGRVMEFKDKTITCCDCHQDFVFTAGEQEFYQTKGLTNEPKRCKACRDKKKQARAERENHKEN